MHLDGKEGLINHKEQNVTIKCCENDHAQWVKGGTHESIVNR
jgi:hypothetical protein